MSRVNVSIAMKIGYQHAVLTEDGAVLAECGIWHAHEDDECAVADGWVLVSGNGPVVDDDPVELCPCGCGALRFVPDHLRTHPMPKEVLDVSEEQCPHSPARKGGRHDYNPYCIHCGEPRPSTPSATGAVAIVRQATADVLGEVAQERVRQDEKWGGPEHDDEHPLSDFADYIGGRLLGIREGRNERKNLREIAALAVAAIESFDRRTAHPSNSEERS